MNKIFKTKYCEKRQTYLATHEKAKIGVPATGSASNGRICLKYNVIALAISALFTQPLLAQGLVNPNVVAGQATINVVNQTNTVIQQTTNKAVINWEKFTIPKDNSVNFQQPDTSSITLNRVLGSQKSEIHGSLKANGQVWLLNPNGTLIGENGSINAHGFMATTHQISNDQFMNGSYSFRKNNELNGDIQNLGVIDIADGGYTVLSADKVINEGVIGARLGTVALAAGEAITIDLVGDQLLSFQVDSVISDGSQKSVTNSGTVSANGGRVLLTAKAASNIVDSVVNSTGVVEAISVEKKNGKIVFSSGSEGTTSIEGTVDVSGKNSQETAGSVEIFGKDVKVANAKIDATGSAGGGNVYVGGGWQGAKVGDHQAAKTVTVSSDSLIDASAISAGDGGEVVIWSDVPDPSSVTRAYGIIKAEGGEYSGDGGKVETSGNALYTKNIQVSTRAKNGEYGLWLLDPTTITIGNGTDNHTLVSGEYTYDGGDANGFIDGPTLNASLDGNNVGITADNITLADSYSDTHTTTLTLNATSVITLTGSFNRAGTIVANAGTTLTGAGGLACGAACTVSIGADSTTYTGVIDTPSFTKQGSGTLNLSAINTIGETTVLSGGIQISNGGALGAGAVGIHDGAFVDLNGQIVSNSFDVQGGVGGGGALKNTSGTLARITATNNGTVAIRGAGNDTRAKIGGSGDLSIEVPITNATGVSTAKLLKAGGSGKLYLKAANTYNGGTQVYSGTVVADHSAALGSTGNIEFTGGTLGITANTQALGADRIGTGSTASISLDVGDGVNYGLSGISYSGGSSSSLIKTGAGNLAFIGTTAFANGVDVQAGDIAIGDNSTATSFSGNLQIASGSNVNFLPTSSMTYTGAIVGSGSINIQGTGSQRFIFNGNTASYSGTTNVNSAVFQVGDGTAGSFQDHAGTVNIDANSALELNPGTSGTITTLINSEGAIRNIAPQDITFSNISAHTGQTSVASNGSITFNNTSSLILTGDITGDGRIAKTGSGQLNLLGNNTFTGGLRIADGNVQLGSSALPTTGTTLEIGTGAVLKVGSATPDYSGIMTFDSTSTPLKISVPAGVTYTMASPITSQTGGILSKRGDGKLILNARFDFGGGATIYGGDLVIGTGGTTGKLNLSNSAFTFHNTGGRYIYNKSSDIQKSHPFRVADASASGSIDNIGTGTLTLTGAIDAGITIPVTATNGEYVLSPGSNTNNSTATFGTVEIGGTLTEGQTLTAVYTITDSDGYTAGSEVVTWYHDNGDGTQTQIATGNTYVLQTSDVGKNIAFEVVFTDGAGNEERSVPFAATQAIASLSGSGSGSSPSNNSANFGTLSITGTLTEGELLTANYAVTDADGANNNSPTVTWYRVSNPSTSIATGNTYRLTTADVGQQIVFEVTFTDDLGNEERSDPGATITPTIAALTTNTGDNSGSTSASTTTETSPSTSTTAETVAEPTQEPIYNDPYLDPNYDPTLDANVDPMLDPNYMDPYMDPNYDPYSDPYYDPNMDPTLQQALGGEYLAYDLADPTFDPNLFFYDPALDPMQNDPYYDPYMDPNFDGTLDPNYDPNMDPNSDGTFVQDPFYEPLPEYSTNDFFGAIANVGLAGDELTGAFESFSDSNYFVDAANFAGETGIAFDQIAEFAGEVDRQVFMEAAELTGEYQLDFFEVAQVAEKVDVRILDDLAFLAGEGGSVVQVLDNAIEEAYDVVRQVSNMPPPGDFGPPPGDFGGPPPGDFGPGPGDFGDVAGGPPPGDLGGPGGDIGGPEAIDVAGDPGLDLAPPPGDFGGPPPGDFGPGPGDFGDVAGGPGPGEFIAPAPTDFAPPIPGDLAALPGDFAPPPGLDLGDIGEFGAEAASFGDFTEFGDVGAPPPGDIGGPSPGDIGPGPGPGGDLGAPPPGDVIDGGPPPGDLPPPGDGPPLADGPDGPPPGDAPPPGDEPAPGDLADGPAGDDGPPPGDEPAPESAEAPGDDVGPGEEPAPESADGSEPAPEVAADGPPPGDGPPAGDTAPAGDVVAAGDTPPPPAGAPPSDALEASAPAAAPAPITADAAPPPPPPVEPPPPSPVPTQKAPTPVDSADAGDKTLAAVAPPSPPKPASQPQAVSVKTVSVVPGGVVNVQVPVPPRPPAGLAGAPKIPSVGNSSNW